MLEEAGVEVTDAPSMWPPRGMLQTVLVVVVAEPAAEAEG
jgi:hypothetical protein